MSALFAVACGGGSPPNWDNLYPTANANWICFDGTRQNGINCLGDNVYTTFHLKAGHFSSAERTILLNTLYGSYNVTILVVSEDTVPSYTGSAETDIIYEKGGGFLGSTTGVTWCDDAVDAYKCDQHYVRIRDIVQTYPKLACHETGHAVGLVHGDLASPKKDKSDPALHCMSTATSGAPSTLGQHHINQINQEWS